MKYHNQWPVCPHCAPCMLHYKSHYACISFTFLPLTATETFTAFYPSTATQPITTTTSSTSSTHCSSPIMGMSPLQPVEVVLNKNRKLIKIGTVSKLACKLAQHSIFGEDNLKSVLQWVEESYHPFQGRKCLNWKKSCVIYFQFLGKML